MAQVHEHDFVGVSALEVVVRDVISGFGIEAGLACSDAKRALPGGETAFKNLDADARLLGEDRCCLFCRVPPQTCIVDHDPPQRRKVLERAQQRRNTDGAGNVLGRKDGLAANINDGDIRSVGKLRL